MFGGATGHAFAPHSKRAGLHIGAHEMDHRRLVQPISTFYGLKRRAVFPGHFDDSGGVTGGEDGFGF